MASVAVEHTDLSTYTTNGEEITNSGNTEKEISETSNREDKKDTDRLDKVSRVQAQTSVIERKDLGFVLISTEDGHYIHEVDPGTTNINNLGLRKGDKLIAVNNVLVKHFHHDLLLHMLENMFDEHEGSLVLFIKRTDDSGYLEQLQIIIDFEIFTSRGPGAEVKITDIRVITWRNKPILTCVRYLSTHLCYIRSTNETGKFLRVTNDGKSLDMAVIYPGNSKETYTFERYIFSGIKSRTEDNLTRRSSIFCVFKHRATKKFMVAKSATKIGLVKLNNDITNQEKADILFFQLKDDRYLESVAYKDRYLSWQKGRLNLKSYDEKEMFFREGYYDIQFDIVTEAALNHVV